MQLTKNISILFILSTIACNENVPIIQHDEIILRPEGNVDWYAGGCVNFATTKNTKVDYAMPNNELINYGFRIEGEFMGSVYIGPDSSIKGRIERKGKINDMKFQYYQDKHNTHTYVFDTGLHPNTPGGRFFELRIRNGYESEMATVLSSLRSGSSRKFPLDYNTPGTIEAAPIPENVDSIKNKCHFQWDLAREYREGFDIVAFLRNLWYKIGADWIPLEGETGYPNIPEHLKR